MGRVRKHFACGRHLTDIRRFEQPKASHRHTVMFPFALAMSLAAAATSPMQGAPPFVHYRLTVDAADTTAYAVEMRIRNAPDTFTVAMAAHPEYDDRFWRFVEGVSAAAPTAIALMDSSRWSVRAASRDVTIRYRIKLPPKEPAPRAAWRPFVAPTGALVGGPRSFLYIVGAEDAPAHVTLELPSSWRFATGMQPTSDPQTVYAATVDELVESPIMAGQLRAWRFA